MLYSDSMPPPDDNIFDRAEALAKRVLNRLGSKIEPASAPSDNSGIIQIGTLLSKIEAVIEAHLERSNARVQAPNRFRVLLTYEESSNLTPQYLKAVSQELTAEVSEYVTNRRYQVAGPVSVEVASDVLAREISVKHFFEDTKESQKDLKEAVEPRSVSRGTLYLTEEHGRVHRVELQVGGPPAYVGRSGECAVRLNDPSISRLHCSLAIRKSGEFVIGDLDSANGTSVAGQLLSSHETRVIKVSDYLHIGDVRLVVSDISTE